MNYIINPSWFYWISVADGAKLFVLLCAILLTIIGTIITIGGAVDEEDEIKKNGIILILVSIVTWIVFIFIPGKQTLIEMMIARTATVDNANWTVETIKSAVDYIVEAIKSMK